MTQAGQGHGECEREPKQEPRQEKQKHGPTRRGVSKEGAGKVGARYKMQTKNEDHETKKKILSEGPNANAGAWIRISRRKTQRARIMVRWGLGVGVEEGVDNGLDEGVD